MSASCTCSPPWPRGRFPWGSRWPRLQRLDSRGGPRRCRGLQTLEGEVAETGLFEATVKLINEIGDPVTLDPAEWQTFANLVPAFSSAPWRRNTGAAPRSACSIPESDRAGRDRRHSRGGGGVARPSAEGVAEQQPEWADGEVEADSPPSRSSRSSKTRSNRHRPRNRRSPSPRRLL